MKTFYVSLAKDLLHVYIEFEAESKQAVRDHLEDQYWEPWGKCWKLPWCSVYEELPANEEGQVVVRSPHQGLIEDHGRIR